jgi:hypothetical protein
MCESWATGYDHHQGLLRSFFASTTPPRARSIPVELR